MKLLVTGANGFLGINLVKELIGQGHYVIALSRGKINWDHPSLKNILVDLNELNSLNIDHDIDAVFHVAARINLHNNTADILAIGNDNILVSYYLADFMIRHGIKKLILSSSCSVYQENYDVNIKTNETSPVRPQNLYAVSKLSSEWILASRLKGVIENYIVLRYSSIYGPGQNPATILPIFIQKARQNQNISIFGSGKRVQDYVYISDAVQANVKSLNTTLPFYTILNIGSGQATTDENLAADIVEIWGSKSKIEILNKHTDAETALNYDIEKAGRSIGYTPIKLKKGLQLYKTI